VWNSFLHEDHLDAQLPRSLVSLLETQGCDTLHTLDLPEGNRSSDDSISAKADQDERVVFSKDKDCIQSHLLLGSPRKLLLITTGNISNQELASSTIAHPEQGPACSQS